MSQFIKSVTVTGVDHFTNRQKLSKNFPFVEWGVLLSRSKMGKESRYPSRTWIEELYAFKLDNPTLRFSGHLCGQWARSFAANVKQFHEEAGALLLLFDRLQLNISHILDDINKDDLIAAINDPALGKCRVIVQVGRRGIPHWWQLSSFMNVDCLFDCSGGRDILPDWWPHPVAIDKGNRVLLDNCGYAGGLTPDNLQDQLPHLEHASEGQPIWIDVESGVRTSDVFDLDKVQRFLDITKPYIINGNTNASSGNSV
jgi:hypothetical protein